MFFVKNANQNGHDFFLQIMRILLEVQPFLCLLFDKSTNDSARIFLQLTASPPVSTPALLGGTHTNTHFHIYVTDKSYTGRQIFLRPRGYVPLWLCALWRLVHKCAEDSSPGLHAPFSSSRPVLGTRSHIVWLSKNMSDSVRRRPCLIL